MEDKVNKGSGKSKTKQVRDNFTQERGRKGGEERGFREWIKLLGGNEEKNREDKGIQGLAE